MTDRYERIREALALLDSGDYCERAIGYSKLRRACDPDTIRELLAERDQLAAALEAAREDAERYRWLRKGANRGANDDVAVVRGLGSMDYGMSVVVYTYSEEIDGYDLDAAIDAHLRESDKRAVADG